MSKKNISDFFPVIKKLEWTDVPVQIVKSDEFYADCVAEANCDSADCENYKQNLKIRLAEHKEKVTKIEKALASCLYIIEKKDKKIAAMQKKCEQPPDISNISNQSQIPLQSNVSSETEPKTTFNIPLKLDELYNNYSGHFSVKQMAELRSCGWKTNDDSSFILSAMRALYGDNLEILKEISVTGRTRNGPPKKPMCTENLKVLRGIFGERLTALKLTPAEMSIRQNKLNIFINSAINNINRNHKSPEMLTLDTQPLRET